MIRAFSAKPTIATKHEETIGKAMLKMAKTEGHKQGVPNTRHPNQYDNLTELERKVLKEKHRYSVAKMAALYNTTQARVREILEARTGVI